MNGQLRSTIIKGSLSCHDVYAFMTPRAVVENIQDKEMAIARSVALHDPEQLGLLDLSHYMTYLDLAVLKGSTKERAVFSYYCHMTKAVVTFVQMRAGLEPKYLNVIADTSIDAVIPHMDEARAISSFYHMVSFDWIERKAQTPTFISETVGPLSFKVIRFEFNKKVGSVVDRMSRDLKPQEAALYTTLRN